MARIQPIHTGPRRPDDKGIAMTKTFLRLCGVLTILALAACAQKGDQLTDKPAPVLQTMTDPETGASVIAGPVLTGTAPRTPGKSSSVSSIGVSAAQSAAALDTTTRAERAQAAAAPAGGERRLGTTIASLGDPSQPGFWIKTPMVSAAGDGRILNPANGKSVKVRMMPLDGPVSGGSQVSLPALQMMGVSLTDLPMIEVYAS